MRIIAHRGYWIKPNEKNTAIAFERALRLNFGIETDIRDVQGKLVVSHDMPSGGEMDFSDFLDLCLLYSKARPLALNIKSDCLHDELRNILEIKKGKR